MFYEKGHDAVRAIIVLTPSESKRLIARAVKEMPEVKAALKQGRIIIIGGTTNAYVAEEILGTVVDKFWFAAGRIANGRLGVNAPMMGVNAPMMEVNAPSRRVKPVVIEKGISSGAHPSDVIKEFTSSDVYIKGANAVDPQGNAGILMSSETGGSIGAAFGILNARGSRIIVPVGLEKLVPSVIEASKKCGKGNLTYSTGETVGMMTLTNASVVTEIEAVAILFPDDGVDVTHVASGGVAGSEGAVVIALEGKDDSVRKVFEYISRLKGEKAITG